MSGGTFSHQHLVVNFRRIAGNPLAGKSCVSGPEDALFTKSLSVIFEVLSQTTRRIDGVA
jgi:hypothetical protein